MTAAPAGQPAADEPRAEQPKPQRAEQRRAVVQPSGADLPPQAVAQRARRLLRWYPSSWRARYGDEFTELLIADLQERPRCWRRTADVARSGLLARLAGAGLTSYPLEPAAAARAGLATMACVAAAFLAVGTAMNSQLAIGFQWSDPGNHDVTLALALMSGALVIFAVLALLAAVPVAWTAICAAVRGNGRQFGRPALLIAAGALILVVGGRHFGNGWPGTGGHWWAAHGLVPSGVAAFGWATTMSITSYWAHPAMLAAFPLAERVWMVLSPAAAACLITGATQLLRRTELSPRVFRYETWLAGVAAASMAAFLGGALCWVTAGGAGPQRLFHVGTIDVAGLAVLAITLVAGWQAAHRARAAGRAALAVRPR